MQFALARGLSVIASGGTDNQNYLRELGAQPVLHGDHVADRLRAIAIANTVDGVFDVAGKTPIGELIVLVDTPTQVVSIANFAAPQEGARVTSARSEESHPANALLQTAELLSTGQLTMPIQTFPIARAAEAYKTSMSGHVRGKLVLLLG